MNARCLFSAIACAACLWLAANSAPVKADKPAGIGETVDAEIAKVWKRDGVTPAATSDDAEFLRRVYLDVVGLPPSGAEARAFLDDKSPGKRAALIDALLADPRYGEHMSDRWMSILRQRGNELEAQGVSAVDVLAVWLAEQFNADAAFDGVIKALVTAEGPISSNPPSAYFGLMGFPARTPNLAGQATRHFAGMQIQCAECHDHHYEPALTQKAFIGMASFFTGIEVNADFYKQPIDPRVETKPIPPRSAIEAYAKSAAMVPEALQRIEDLLTYDRPQLLGDQPVKSRDSTVWRTLYAGWLTSPKNNTAKRYLANRFWSFLFGSGLMNPVDDFNSLNEASHPELLAALGDWFAGNGYSVKRLYRALLNSRVYQLSSKGGDGGEAWHFNRAAVRQLSPEQFFGTLLGLRDGDTILRTFARANVNAYTTLRQLQRVLEMQENAEAIAIDDALLTTFEKHLEKMRPDWAVRRAMAVKYAAQGTDDEQAVSETLSLSIDQALHALNGEVTRRLGDSRNGSLIYAIRRDFKGAEAQIEALYLATLSRRPSAPELKRALEYLKSSNTPEQLGFEDLFYALVSTTEFATNH